MVSVIVCEAIVRVTIITMLQQIRAKIYIQISMTSFCVLSSFEDVYINILKNLPVDILQVNKSVWLLYSKICFKYLLANCSKAFHSNPRKFSRCLSIHVFSVCFLYMDVSKFVMCVYIRVGVMIKKMLIFKSTLHYGHVIFILSQRDDPSF